MQTRSLQKQLIHVFFVSIFIVLIGGGIAWLNQWQQGPLPSYASDDNVVGSPSLPASLVDTIFRRVGSPMVGTGQAVAEAAQAQHIDDAFALAVWWTETNDGAAGVGLHDHNPGSVRGSVGYPSAFDGYTIYPSYSDAVTYWFGMLKKVYINRGLTTVFAISHPYVGTSTSNLWAGKVITLMNRYRAEAPPQQPTISPATQITVASAHANMQRHAQALWQQDQNGAIPLQNTPQQSVSNTSPNDAGGLNGTIKWWLVLFNLLAALGVGLVARKMLQRYTTAPQTISLLENDLQAKIRAGIQRVATSWPTPSQAGAWRTTEGLTWSGPMTGALATPYGTLPTSSSDALFSLGMFMSTQMREMASTPHPQPQSAHAGAWSPRNTHQPSTAQFPSLPMLGLPSRPLQSSSTTALSPLHRTRLLPSRPTASQWAPVTTTLVAEPQLVGAGSGNSRSSGLLSRYREMQDGQLQRELA